MVPEDKTPKEPIAPETIVETIVEPIVEPDETGGQELSEKDRANLHGTM